MQDCSTPDCKSHNLLLTMHEKNWVFFVCIMADNNVFLTSVNVVRLCQDRMTQLDYFTIKLYFGIVCGQIMVVLPVVFYRKSKYHYKNAIKSLKHRKDQFWETQLCFLARNKSFKHSKTAKRSHSSIVDGFTNMCDITNNFLSKLSIRGGSGHLFLFCKIVVVLLIYQLFLRLCQKPWKN